MKKTLLALISLTTLLLGFFLLGPSQHPSNFVSGELLFKVSSHDEALTLSTTHDLTLKHVSSMNIATFEYAKHHDVLYLESLGFSRNSVSEIVRPPWERPTSTVDPYMSDQYTLSLMQTIDAWEIETGNENVVVAIIDTGIDINHDEFAGRISPLSYNSYTETVGLSAVIDDHGHGTMVAGVIGANKDNGKGIAGIAQNVKLLVIKANVPTEGKFQDNALINGIYYAIEQGVDIINMSLGGTYLNPQTKTALDVAKNAGIVVVAAAGNDGTNDLFYPAAFATTLSISAIDAQKTLASFSNYGSTIDLTAPGVGIVTTSRNNGYVTTSGTSFASPQVAGVLALLISRFPDLSRDALIERLILTSEDLGELGKDAYFGHGMVNTYHALTLAYTDVHFETFGLVNVPSVQAIVNQPLTNIPQPEKSGYVFLGWYKDAALTTPFTASDLVTENMTLYGRFDSQYVTITYKDGQNTLASDILFKGTSALLFTPTKPDYRFLYWSYDALGNTPYTNELLYEDTTLYAQYEAIIYKTLTLVLDDQIYQTTIKEVNESITLPTLSREGYQFIGWFESTTETYYLDTYILTNDVTLTAIFEVIEFTLTLYLDGELFDQVLVQYGDTFIPTLIESNTFTGWFLEPDLQVLYYPSPVKNSFVLYGKSASSNVTLTLIDSVNTFTFLVEPDAPVTLYTPSVPGKTFIGWSTSESQYISLTDTTFTSDTTLYAFFEEDIYTVRFYDYTQSIIVFETFVTYGEAVIPPLAGIKPDSTHFTYTFLTYSASTQNVTASMDVFPIYSRQFKAGSAYLLPGVDTLKQGQEWHDEGIFLQDDSLIILTESSVNSLQRGRYTVLYHIEGSEGRLYTLTRIVRVTEEQPLLSLILNKAKTTLRLNETYVEAGATYSGGTLTIMGEVNSSVPGVYVITYTISNNGSSISRTRYVFVLESEAPNTVAYYSKKEGDFYA